MGTDGDSEVKKDRTGGVIEILVGMALLCFCISCLAVPRQLGKIAEAIKSMKPTIHLSEHPVKIVMPDKKGLLPDAYREPVK